VRITIDDLKAAGAREDCPGLAWFREFFGGDVADREWTFELQMEVIRSEGRRWLMWAVHRRKVPLFSMRGAKLSAANLRDADLSGADLSGADLRWTDLRWTDLNDANLRGANLNGADLHGANLTWGNLTWANLSGADLSGANLTGASLTGASLTDAKHDETTRWPKGWSSVSEERK
jgi:hypothetical protein